MRSGAFSYRKFWKYPIKIYQLGKGKVSITFSKGIELRQMAVSAIIILIFVMFRKVINAFLPGTLQLAFYAILPWVIAGALCRTKMDGKRLDRFLLQSILYLFSRRTCYSSYKPVYLKQMKKPQKYEPLR
ncbi:TcpE family protein [compost metagenome]